MGKEIITFGDIEVKKHKFHKHKNTISLFQNRSILQGSF